MPPADIRGARPLARLGWRPYLPAMLPYLERGAGRPLVLIPGLEGAKEYWRPQLDALGGRHRVIACDLPVLRPKLDRRMADYAGRVLELMDGLGVGSAVVMGASLGGLVALEVAASAPWRVDGLVLVSALDRPSFGGFGLNMFTVATAAAAGALAPGFPQGRARRWLRWAGRYGGYFLDDLPAREELIDYALRYGTAAGPGALADRAIAALRAGRARRSAGPRVPVLLLRGGGDRLVSAAAFDALGSRLRAQRVVLSGAGHCCTLSAAEEANRAILGWLDRTFEAPLEAGAGA